LNFGIILPSVTSLINAECITLCASLRFHVLDDARFLVISMRVFVGGALQEEPDCSSYCRCIQ